ncbi:hypothetical protein MD588_24185 [Photobacterium sp. SDRW27]|uniref:hypothetical protein n=1 Tax=Photobacterium obscurum TaxID=2829490 RepID=UPI0022437B29|nr:hypothetical protein [Photobacterium obscurum]MCW8331903.1 hypothetical protein [Photobacterium obscurum]
MKINKWVLLPAACAVAGASVIGLTMAYYEYQSAQIRESLDEKIATVDFIGFSKGLKALETTRLSVGGNDNKENAMLSKKFVSTVVTSLASGEIDRAQAISAIRHVGVDYLTVDKSELAFGLLGDDLLRLISIEGTRYSFEPNQLETFLAYNSGNAKHSMIRLISEKASTELPAPAFETISGKILDRFNTDRYRYGNAGAIVNYQDEEVIILYSHLENTDFQAAGHKITVSPAEQVRIAANMASAFRVSPQANSYFSAHVFKLDEKVTANGREFTAYGYCNAFNQEKCEKYSFNGKHYYGDSYYVGMARGKARAYAELARKLDVITFKNQ